MPTPKKSSPQRSTLHTRNIHQGRYDLVALSDVNPELKRFFKKNPAGQLTVDFHNPRAIVALNQALLKKYYGIAHWQIPEQALCPPIPGRADYIHHLADLLKAQYAIRSPKNTNVRVLDVGTGASLIYPILGVRLYGWQFTASDVETSSLQNAQSIIESNANLQGCIELRRQAQRQKIFHGIVEPDDYFHLTLCNPPFHASREDAQQGSQRKVSNLKHKGLEPAGTVKAATLNFGGQSNELWCEGGERAFILKIIRESEAYSTQVGWFTCLVSKSDNLASLKRALKKTPAVSVKVVSMVQGQKVSRFLAWTFQSSEALKRHAPAV